MTTMPFLCRSIVVLTLLCASAIAQKIEVVTPGGKLVKTMNGGAIIDANGTVTLQGLSTAGSLTLTIEGGGSSISTGYKGAWQVPYACTINSITMGADQTGSIVVDVWKDTYANYPPTVLDTITAAAKPTISAATKSQDLVLTGWNKTINAGDWLAFNVDSSGGTITRLVLVFSITK